jgi:hypothetical protein
VPLSAIDTIGPAFQHARQQVFEPFRFGQWARLALVGILAGELGSGGGCHSPNFAMPRHPGRSGPVLGSRLPPELANHAALLGLLVVFLIIFGVAIVLFLLYVSSVMRFILFDSVVAKQCRIGEGWRTRQGPGLRYFVWHILLLLASMAGLAVLIGIPAAFALAAGWLRHPSEHMLPLVLCGSVLLLVVLGFVVILALVQVMTKDFVVPQMALEGISPVEGWRRLWPQVAAEMGGYAGYVGMKIVLAIAAAVVIGIISFIAFLLLLIPMGALGIAAVFTGKAAGLTWTVYTITLAVVAGFVAVVVFVYVIGLISVPAMVFFPAYSIYFFAARYPALAGALERPPAAPPSRDGPPSLPEPPALPPTPEPVG